MVVKMLDKIRQVELRINFSMQPSTDQKFPHQFLLDWFIPTPIRSGSYSWPKEEVGRPMSQDAQFWAEVLDNHFLLKTFPNYRDIAPVDQLDSRVFGVVELDQVEEANTRLYNEALNTIRTIEKQFPLTRQLYNANGTLDTKIMYYSRLVDETSFKPRSS